jgi:uncharacterized RDD family membrane protein YckC
VAACSLPVTLSAYRPERDADGAPRFDPFALDPHQLLLSAVLALLWFVAEAFFIGQWGGTPGRLLVGLRVIRSDGSRASFRDGFARTAVNLVQVIPIAGGIAGCGVVIASFVMLFNGRRQTVNDRIAHTYVVRAT